QTRHVYAATSGAQSDGWHDFAPVRGGTIVLAAWVGVACAELRKCRLVCRDASAARDHRSGASGGRCSKRQAPGFITAFSTAAVPERDGYYPRNGAANPAGASGGCPAGARRIYSGHRESGWIRRSATYDTVDAAIFRQDAHTNRRDDPFTLTAIIRDAIPRYSELGIIFCGAHDQRHQACAH